jgi:hypothetical protein
MNKSIVFILLICLSVTCKDHNNAPKRIPVAQIDKMMLYYDEIPRLIQKGTNAADSAAIIRNYINNWAKRVLLLQKAEENLSPGIMDDIARQLEETRVNLVIYQYQRQLMLEKMDTVISDTEIKNYYLKNQKNFLLNSNIVKALFIKLPLETPDLAKVRRLARSEVQADQQELESYCYQFAEKFDDFNEEWVPMTRLSVELQSEIDNEENFLKRTSFFETSDSSSVYLISVRDYRLRGSEAPFEYVREDIRRLIWNSRRFEFIQSLENGIYNDALKKNSFKIY